MDIVYLRKRADALGKKVKDLEHLARCINEVETSERSHRNNLIGLGKVFAFIGQQDVVSKHTNLRELFVKGGQYIVKLTELSNQLIMILNMDYQKLYEEYMNSRSPVYPQSLLKSMELAQDMHTFEYILDNDALLSTNPSNNTNNDDDDFVDTDGLLLLPQDEQDEIINECQRDIDEYESILPQLSQQIYQSLFILSHAITHLTKHVDPFEDYHKMTHTLDHYYNTLLRDDDRLQLASDCRLRYGPNRTIDEKIIITQRYPRYELLIANIIPFTRKYFNCQQNLATNNPSTSPSAAASSSLTPQQQIMYNFQHIYDDIFHLHQVIKGQSVILNNNVGVSKYQLKIDPRCPSLMGEMVRVDEVDDYIKIKSRDMLIFHDRILSLRNDVQSVFGGNLINQGHIIHTCYYQESLLLVHSKKEWIVIMPNDPHEYRENHLIKKMQGYVDFSRRHIINSPGFLPFTTWRKQLHKAMVNQVNFPDFHKELYVTWLPSIEELPSREKKRSRRSSVSSVSSNSSVSSYSSTQSGHSSNGSNNMLGGGDYDIENKMIHLSATTSTGWDKDMLLVHPSSDNRMDIIEMIIGLMITSPYNNMSPEKSSATNASSLITSRQHGNQSSSFSMSRNEQNSTTHSHDHNHHNDLIYSSNPLHSSSSDLKTLITSHSGGNMMMMHNNHDDLQNHSHASYHQRQDLLPNALSTIGISRRRSLTPANAAAAVAAADRNGAGSSSYELSATSGGAGAAAAAGAGVGVGGQGIPQGLSMLNTNASYHTNPNANTPSSNTPGGGAAGGANNTTTPRQQGRRKSFFGTSNNDKTGGDNRKDDDMKQLERMHQFFEMEFPGGNQQQQQQQQQQSAYISSNNNDNHYDHPSTIRSTTNIRHQRSRSGSVAGLSAAAAAAAANAMTSSTDDSMISNDRHTFTTTPSGANNGSGALHHQQQQQLRTQQDRRHAMNRKSAHFRTVDLSRSASGPGNGNGSGSGQHQLAKPNMMMSSSTPYNDDDDSTIDQFFSELSLQDKQQQQQQQQKNYHRQQQHGNMNPSLSAAVAGLGVAVLPTGGAGNIPPPRISPAMAQHVPKPLNIDFIIDENDTHDEQSPSSRQYGSTTTATATLRNQIMSPSAASAAAATGAGGHGGFGTPGGMKKPMPFQRSQVRNTHPTALSNSPTSKKLGGAPGGGVSRPMPMGGNTAPVPMPSATATGGPGNQPKDIEGAPADCTPQ